MARSSGSLGFIIGDGRPATLRNQSSKTGEKPIIAPGPSLPTSTSSDPRKLACRPCRDAWPLLWLPCRLVSRKRGKMAHWPCRPFRLKRGGSGGVREKRTHRLPFAISFHGIREFQFWQKSGPRRFYVPPAFPAIRMSVIHMVD